MHNQYTHHPPHEIIRPIGPSIAYVNVGRGMFSLIDDSYVEIVKPYHWHTLRKKKGTESYYAVATLRGDKVQALYMHRLILGLEFGDKRMGDHIQARATLDNRRANLRIATHAQNRQNTGIQRQNTSGFKGVTKTRKGFAASIAFEGKQRFLGYFPTPEEAHAAYCKAAHKHHGEFARTE